MEGQGAQAAGGCSLPLHLRQTPRSSGSAWPTQEQRLANYLMVWILIVEQFPFWDNEPRWTRPVREVPVQNVEWQKVETQNVESQNVKSDKRSKMTNGRKRQKVENDKIDTVEWIPLLPVYCSPRNNIILG